MDSDFVPLPPIKFPLAGTEESSGSEDEDEESSSAPEEIVTTKLKKWKAPVKAEVPIPSKMTTCGRSSKQKVKVHVPPLRGPRTSIRPGTPDTPSASQQLSQKSARLDKSTSKAVKTPQQSKADDQDIISLLRSNLKNQIPSVDVQTLGQVAQAASELPLVSSSILYATFFSNTGFSSQPLCALIVLFTNTTTVGSLAGASSVEPALVVVALDVCSRYHPGNDLKLKSSSPSQLVIVCKVCFSHP